MAAGDVSKALLSELLGRLGVAASLRTTGTDTFPKADIYVAFTRFGDKILTVLPIKACLALTTSANPGKRADSSHNYFALPTNFSRPVVIKVNWLKNTVAMGWKDVTLATERKVLLNPMRTSHPEAKTRAFIWAQNVEIYPTTTPYVDGSDSYTLATTGTPPADTCTSVMLEYVRRILAISDSQDPEYARELFPHALDYAEMVMASGDSQWERYDRARSSLEKGLADIGLNLREVGGDYFIGVQG